MRDINNDRWENVIEYSIPTAEELEQVAKVLCERALSDAKSQLHPLLQNFELDCLDQRPEFLRAFKCALEHEISRKLAAWHPGIQTIFSYEEAPFKNIEDWHGSIIFLLKVPCLTEEVKALGKKLDNSLEPVCKIGKEENRSNGDHRREIGGSFFIASGNATKLFETIDEPFNDIPLSVLLFVE